MGGQAQRAARPTSTPPGAASAGPFNGIATAGDYLSASTFLGYAGLMYLYGFDGWIIGLGALLSFLPVLYLLAERMRNAGKFTVADVLASACEGGPVRIATAINTLLISGIYLVAQLVGAGGVIEALAGISFPLAVMICGVFMVVYVVFGGMLATTWVQIIKAGMLMTAGVASPSPCWPSSTSARPSCSTRPPPSTPTARRSSAPART